MPCTLHQPAVSGGAPSFTAWTSSVAAAMSLVFIASRPAACATVQARPINQHIARGSPEPPPTAFRIWSAALLGWLPSTPPAMSSGPGTARAVRSIWSPMRPST